MSVVGQIRKWARNWAVRFTLKNRHRQPGLSGPKSATSGHIARAHLTGGLWKFPATAENFLPRGP